jgi:hypothetical protein
MKRIFKLALLAGFAASAAPSSAQSIGAACGCPPVSSRPNVNLSTLLTGGNLTNNVTTLTCNNLYTLDVTMYVNDGQDLYIEPGTVIKANQAPVGTNAYTLVVSRGGQIWANGSASCPIIMTASADPLNGTYAVTNRGKWGGLILLGRARNNVRNADLRDGGPNPSNSITGTDGVGVIEGLLPISDPRNHYGMPIGQENDNDNSGVLRYVSVRHGGQIIGTANEVNGITFGSVGRGTKVEYVEASSNLDDGLEFFGGTVDVKYASALFVDDDYVDYDQEYRGRIQFFYGLQGPDNSGGTNNQGDNGMECDGDDGPGNTAPKSNPTIYNATIIGRWTATGGSGDEALEVRREAQGKIINSIFTNFRSGISLSDAAVTNWNNGSFEVKNCTFQTRADQTNAGDPVADTFKRVRINGGNASAADYTKFTADGNLSAGFNTLIDASFAISPLTSNTVTDRVNPVPSAGAAGAQSTISAPIDDFFTGARYRGAFEPGAEPWTKGWSVVQTIKADVSAVAGCVGDLNKDGVINSLDFTLFSGAFNGTCF